MGGNETRKNCPNSEGHPCYGNGVSGGSNPSNKFKLEPRSPVDMRAAIGRASRQSEIYSEINDFQWRLRYARKIVPISGVLTIIALLLAYTAAYIEWVAR